MLYLKTYPKTYPKGGDSVSTFPAAGEEMDQDKAENEKDSIMLDELAIIDNGGTIEDAGDVFSSDSYNEDGTGFDFHPDEIDIEERTHDPGFSDDDHIDVLNKEE